jgi:hypothetical protein
VPRPPSPPSPARPAARLTAAAAAGAPRAGAARRRCHTPAAARSARGAYLSAPPGRAAPGPPDTGLPARPDQIGDLCHRPYCVARRARAPPRSLRPDVSCAGGRAVRRLRRANGPRHRDGPHPRPTAPPAPAPRPHRSPGMTVGKVAPPARSLGRRQQRAGGGGAGSAWAAWAAPALTYALVAHVLYGALQGLLRPQQQPGAAPGAVDLWAPMAGAQGRRAACGVGEGPCCTGTPGSRAHMRLAHAPRRACPPARPPAPRPQALSSPTATRWRSTLLRRATGSSCGCSASRMARPAGAAAAAAAATAAGVRAALWRSCSTPSWTRASAGCCWGRAARSRCSWRTRALTSG